MVQETVAPELQSKSVERYASALASRVVGDGSQPRVQRVMPERPARSEALNSAGVSPMGVTTPLPVTTTRCVSSRRPSVLMSNDNPACGARCSLYPAREFPRV